MIPTVIDEDSLSLMTYAELRKIAKTYGVKANMKAEKLCKAILEKVAGCGKAQEEIVNIEVKEKPDSQQSEVPDSNARKRKRIRRGTYDINDEDREIKVESNDTVAEELVVPKKPRKSNSPKRNVKKEKSSIPRPRRKYAPVQPPNMKLHTPRKNSISQLSVKKPAVKSLIRSRTPNFARIHEKAFSKMDSLDKFVQKKQQRSALLLKSPLPIVAARNVQKENKSAVSKIPTISLSVKPIDFSFGKTPMAGKIFKFSAKPSADKVALVKPRTMKILSENPQNFCGRNFSLHKIRQEKEKKEIIKGVRTNRRFELQMKNRGVICK